MDDQIMFSFRICECILPSVRQLPLCKHVTVLTLHIALLNTSFSRQILVFHFKYRMFKSLFVLFIVTIWSKTCLRIINVKPFELIKPTLPRVKIEKLTRRN